jgi:hypothetical protein
MHLPFREVFFYRVFTMFAEAFPIVKSKSARAVTYSDNQGYGKYSRVAISTKK